MGLSSPSPMSVVIQVENLTRWWTKARSRPDPPLMIGATDHGHRVSGEPLADSTAVPTSAIPNPWLQTLLEKKHHLRRMPSSPPRCPWVAGAS